MSEILKTIIIKPQGEREYAVVELSLDGESLEVLGTQTLLLTKKYPLAILEARKQRSLRGLEN